MIPVKFEVTPEQFNRLEVIAERRGTTIRGLLAVLVSAALGERTRTTVGVTREVSAQRNREIRQLRARGMSQAEIGRRLGISQEAVGARLKRMRGSS